MMNLLLRFRSVPYSVGDSSHAKISNFDRYFEILLQNLIKTPIIASVKKTRKRRKLNGT